MMTLLDHQMSDLASRFRRLQWWRNVTLVCTLLGFMGGSIFLLQAARIVMHPISGWLLIGTALVALVLISVVSRRRFRNVWSLAHTIEAHYPELEQRLITTLDERKRHGERLGYLQHVVLQETMAHAHHNRWTEIVPWRQIRDARGRGLVGICLVMALSLALLEWQPEPYHRVDVPAIVAQLQPAAADFDIQVEPGNAELEQGTNLVVIARFGKQVPKTVELVAQSAAEEVRVEMSRTLEDPLFGGTLPAVQEDLEYYVSYDGQRSERFRVTTFSYPRLVRADALLEFPGYTQVEAKRLEDTRRVSAVEGTRISWEMHLNKPNITATLVPAEGSDEIPLLLDANDPLKHLASLELRETVSWKLQLTDADGRKNRNPPTITAKVTPNRPPSLKLDVARDVRVSPLEEFLVKATVSDDYGLRRYGLNYTLASASPQDVVLGENSGRREKKEAEHMLAFEALKASPDELLSYYFWAEDEDAAGNPRRLNSDMFFAEVRHFEEIFRESQQPPGGSQKQQQQNQQGQPSENAQDAEQLAELQKQIINATWRVIRREIATAVTPVFADDVSTILESQQTAIEQLQQLGQNLQDNESQRHLLETQSQMQESLQQLTDAYADKLAAPLTPAMNAQRAAYQALLKLRAREHEVTQGQQQQSGSQSSSSASRSRFQQQLQQLQLQNDQNRYETQRQAEEQQDEEQTELRQALSRLRELAQRQEDLNKQLQELQNALEQAESEEERQEIERQLKRLREQQQEMLRDTDELMDRLDESQSQETLQETREQLEQTRERLRDSAKSLEQGEVTPALASGTRAQRELEEMREELRRESANQFSEQMQEMRDKARELEAAQQELGERMQQNSEMTDGGSGLRTGERSDEQLGDALRDQNERLKDLLREIEETVREAEESEPLLADSLYDAFRQTEEDFVQRNLEQAAELSDRGFTEPAQRVEQEAREGISSLRGNVERAAESVLGDETDALRTAVRMLEDLERQLDDEIRQFDETSSQQSASQPSQADEDPDNPRQDAAPGEPSRGTRPNEADPSSSERGPSEAPNPAETPEDSASQQSSQRPGSPSEPSPSRQGERTSPSSSSSRPNPDSQQPQDSQDADQPAAGDQPPAGNSPREPSEPQRGGLRQLRQLADPSSRQDGGGLGGFEQLEIAPITGDDFREWSDRMRDVEEIVTDPELRAEATRIRERARGFRREFKRHSKEPQWDLVKELVARPLRELRQQVSEELLRRSAEKNAIVPLDRDPVPEEFSEQVRRYYENLGRGE